MRVTSFLVALAICGCGSELAAPVEPDVGAPDSSTLPADSAQARCGDGVVAESEECDDGVLNSDIEPDVCRSDCRTWACGDGVVDSGEECDRREFCSEACRVTEGCGDGVIQESEMCDDGDTEAGDGCDAECELEGEERCGDGVLSRREECDDGDTESGDGCSEECLFESTECGDGIVGADEECDDGNTDETDECTDECLVARCGDGIVQLDEECDDGNLNPADGCSHLCRLPSCGDGVRQSGEHCDAGTENGTPGVECRVDCTLPLCGDGVVDSGEICDAGDPLAEACPFCGRATSRVSLVNLLMDGRTVALRQPERADGPVISAVESPGVVVGARVLSGSRVVDLMISDGTLLDGLESDFGMGPTDHYTFVVIGGSGLLETLVIREDESEPPDGGVRIRVINGVSAGTDRLTIVDADRDFPSESILFGSRFGQRSADSTRAPGPFRVEVIAQDSPDARSWIFDLGDVHGGADHSVYVTGTIDAPLVIRTSTNREVVVATPLDR